MSEYSAESVGTGSEMSDGNTPVLDSYPLTPMQFGLAFESSIAAVPGVNIEQVVCRFTDEQVDPALLERAWRATQAHHDVLRTSIDLEHPDGPTQHVHAACSLEVATLDWRALDDAEQERALEEWLAVDRSRGLDLADPCASRVTLIDMGPDRSTMVWTFHHALLDGRSFATVLEEVLGRLDELVESGTMAPRAERPRFRDHVAAVTGPGRDDVAAKAFFCDLLAGHTEPTPAPGASAELAAATESVHGGDGPLRHDEVERRLGAAFVTRLEARAAQADATVGSALLAAWSVLQSRYCSSTDVVFGTTRAGRHQVDGAADMVGCLINTVPIRLRPAADSTVDELLRAARAFQLDVRPHEHAALVDIRSWSDVSGDRPLMSTTVVFDRELLDTRLRSGGGRPGRHVTVHEQASSPLMLAAYLDDGLVLRLEYDTARYRSETVDVMADHLARLLESFAESEPETRIGDLEMLGHEERRRLLEDRNPSRPVPEPTGRYVDRFEEQVERHPHDIAVESVDPAESLSYRELDERANRLAHVLVAAGASQEHPVGVCLARSPDFVVSILAVLKAGAWYLPLDPAYPRAALSHMLEDSGARLVLTDSASAAQVPAGDGREVLVVDRLATLGAAPTSPPERAPAGAEDLAYVIYTSGTTGTPKGVMVSDRSLGAFCTAVAQRYELTSSDRVLQFSSLSFDVSVEELLPTLSVGAAVVLRSEDMSSSMRSLVEASGQAGLSVLNLPSAIWHTLVEHLDSTGDRLAPSVRLVVVGGEKVSRVAYEVWARLHPEVRWLNGYGPTETTVTCTSFDPAGRYELGSGRELPIGRPLANARAYVLDETGSFLVPDGQAGELWIGGSGVAQGYLGRAGLTAERFRPDPFVADPAARMYRTGDRARWSDSGDLEYLGRSDRQIKLRGFRIEPGEVEGVLEQHPEVRQAFVSLRSDPLGGERLVAWVVADGDAPDPARVLAEARGRLPRHAVPSAVVVTDELVRTPAGKVDVDALPAPRDHQGPHSGQGSPGEAPADEREADLCRVFGEVLGRSRPVAADASFFDLGGHSLLAVRLIGRLDAELGTRVSLSTLHRAPSPRALALELVAEPGTAGASGAERPGEPERVYLSAIQPLGDRPPLYGIHVLGTNGAFFRPLATRLGVDQPVFGLSATDPDEQTPTAVEEIAARYVEEIEQHHPVGPLALAAVSLGGFVAFEVAQQLVARGRDVQVLALFDSAGPGGRPTVPTRRRIAIHAELVRTGGREYVAGAARRLLATLRERSDTIRVRLHRRAGSDTPDDLWMHRFVLANAAAADRYVARPYSGPITVFHAAEEVFDTPEAIRTALGWSCVAAGPIEVVEVPGRHMSMLEEPHVAVLADELRAAIDRGGA